MRDIRDLFADYASYHQTKGNKWFHRLGIPLIVLSLIGMLARVPVWQQITGAVVLIVIAEIAYFMLDWRFGVLMLLISAAFYVIGMAIPLLVNVALFIPGMDLPVHRSQRVRASAARLSQERAAPARRTAVDPQ